MSDRVESLLDLAGVLSVCFVFIFCVFGVLAGVSSYAKNHHGYVSEKELAIRHMDMHHEGWRCEGE